MKINTADLKTAPQAEKALTDHRADRAANKTRREELNTLIGDYQAEVTALEREYEANKDDENILLRRIGQIAVGE